MKWRLRRRSRFTVINLPQVQENVRPLAESMRWTPEQADEEIDNWNNFVKEIKERDNRRKR